MFNSNSNSNSNSHSDSSSNSHNVPQHTTTYAPSTYSTYSTSTSTTSSSTTKPIMSQPSSSNTTPHKKAWSKAKTATKNFVDSFKLGGPSVAEIEAERVAKHAGMSEEERIRRFGMMPHEEYRGGPYSGRVWT